MLKNLHFCLFYKIKKLYLCTMFLQCVNSNPFKEQQCRKSQQQMLGERVCR